MSPVKQTFATPTFLLASSASRRWRSSSSLRTLASSKSTASDLSEKRSSSAPQALAKAMKLEACQAASLSSSVFCSATSARFSLGAFLAVCAQASSTRRGFRSPTKSKLGASGARRQRARASLVEPYRLAEAVEEPPTSLNKAMPAASTGQSSVGCSHVGAGLRQYPAPLRGCAASGLPAEVGSSPGYRHADRDGQEGRDRLKAEGESTAGASASGQTGEAGRPEDTRMTHSMSLAAGVSAELVVGAGASRAAIREAEDTYWRKHFESRPYVEQGASYEDYGPAYRHGIEAYYRYPGRSFDDIEPEWGRSWSTARGASNLDWYRAKLASFDAWQRLADQAERSRGSGRTR